MVDHEVTINPIDTTAPDLVSGEAKAQPVGLPLLNHSSTPLSPLFIRVEESEWLEEWTGSFPGIGGTTMTKVPIWIHPKDVWPEEGTVVSVEVHFSAEGLEYSYVHTFDLTVASADIPGPYRRTFISKTDGSAQFFGEMGPTEINDGEEYALALSLHGASVDAKNQANSYAAKDWIYHIAATNRRPFGFDWQAWGRRDAIEVLNYAMENYPIDPWRVHLTGHSMGGHGTWHVGTLFANRFATLGPSAGWINFENYGGTASPDGAFGWNQLHFDPRSFKENLKDKGVYIIHGTADDNVPIWHAETMFELLTDVVPDLFFHKEEGAGHWWDASDDPGVDCVDWAPLFALMKEREVDPMPLNFHYTAPSPWINSEFSYVTYDAMESPDSLGTLDSVQEGTTVTLTTTNIRRMTLNTGALENLGVTDLVVNGATVSLEEDEAAWGTETGKKPHVYGPFNQIFHAPFCIVYEEGPVLEAYAAYLLANWAIIGNGTGCSLPKDRLTDQVKDEYQILYLGATRGALNIPESLPVTWGYNGVGVGNDSFPDAAMAFIFPDEDQLAGAMVTTPGDEILLYRLMPFTSRFVIPDYYLWTYGGGLSTGFFTPDWSL
jgi:pimeloyl-ACP methyl ester carboxylesterase